MAASKKVFNFSDQKQAVEFAKRLGAKLKGGEIIELIGDVGSGKTTLVKGIAEGMGSKDHVTSPTFTIQQVYNGTVDLYHYDFYRLSDPGIMSHELEEALGQQDAAIAVEWAETVGGVLPKDRIKIRIRPTGASSREIQLEAPKVMELKA